MAEAVPSPPEDTSSEARFLAYAQSGDERLLDELLQAHLPKARAAARRILTGAAEAEDAVQEAMVQLVAGAKEYDGSVPFGAWFGRLVQRAAIDQWRVRRRRGRRELPVESASGRVDAPQTERPADALLRQLVSDLPDTYREPIELRYFHGLSAKETGRRLGLGDEAVAKRLLRARELLRDALRRRGRDADLAAVAALLAPLRDGPARSSGAIVRGAAAHRRALAWASGVGIAFALSAAAVALNAHRAPASAPPVAAPPADGAAVAAGTATDHVDPATSGRRSYRWDFDRGAPPELRVVSGGWHFAPGAGVGGSGGMETDDELILTVDVEPFLTPIRMDLDIRTRPAAANSLFLTYAAPRRLAVLENLGATWDMTPDADGFAVWSGVREFLAPDHEEVFHSVRNASTRLWLDFLDGCDERRLLLIVHGRFRLDNLSLRSIAAREVPDVSRFRDAVDAVPPERRRGRVILDGLIGDAGRPVQANFWTSPEAGGPGDPLPY